MPISTVLQGAASLLRCTVVLLEVSVGHSTTILLLSQEIALSSVNLEQVGQTQCCTLTECMSFCAAATIQLPKIVSNEKIGCGSSAEKPFISDNTVWLHYFKVLSSQWIYFEY